MACVRVAATPLHLARTGFTSFQRCLRMRLGRLLACGRLAGALFAGRCSCRALPLSSSLLTLLLPLSSEGQTAAQQFCTEAAHGAGISSGHMNPNVQCLIWGPIAHRFSMKGIEVHDPPADTSHLFVRPEVRAWALRALGWMSGIRLVCSGCSHLLKAPFRS